MKLFLYNLKLYCVCFFSFLFVLTVGPFWDLLKGCFIKAKWDYYMKNSKEIELRKQFATFDRAHAETLEKTYKQYTEIKEVVKTRAISALTSLAIIIAIILYKLT